MCDSEKKEQEELEFHKTFCKGSPGCQYPGCWQRIFEEMNDGEDKYHPSDDEYDYQDDGERFCFYCNIQFNQGVRSGTAYYNVCDKCTENTYRGTSQENLYDEPGTVCQEVCLNCKANPSKDEVCICREGDSE